MKYPNGKNKREILEKLAVQYATQHITLPNAQKFIDAEIDSETGSDYVLKKNRDILIRQLRSQERKLSSNKGQICKRALLIVSGGSPGTQTDEIREDLMDEIIDLSLGLRRNPSA